MVVLSTPAVSTIFVALLSPPPPPPPAGMSAEAISAPLLFVRARRTVFASSLNSAVIPKTVPASTSLSLVATALFWTGLELSASRLSSTSILSIVRLTLPSASAVCFLPFTVRLFIVPAPPKSSQLASCVQLSIFVPMNCFVRHFP